MAKRKAPKSPKNAAREFYDRRRTGIDRKVRSLITGESNDYGVEMNVTIIYEYANEVSFFRSHVNEESARWFSSFAELKNACVKGKNTDMGCVDQATLELIKWQQSQKSGPSGIPQSKSTQAHREATEDILGSTHPSMLGQNHNGEDESQNETEGDSEEDTHNEDSDTSDAEEDDGYTALQDTSTLPNQHVPILVVPDSHRDSPKRKRTSDDDYNTVQYQSPPALYPPYGTYTAGNGQIQVPSQQLHISGQTASLGNYSLLPQNQNAIGINTTDVFGGYDVPLTQNYNDPAFQPDQLQNILPIHPHRMPKVPQGRKAKASKSMQSKQSNVRRKTTI